MLKKAVTLILLVSFLISAASCSSSGKKVAATVNGDPIYMEEVDRQLDQLKQQHQQLQGQEGEQYAKSFQKQILDDLIDQKLVLQEAEKQNVKVSDKEIDDWLKQVKKMFPSEQQFQSKLKELKMTLDELKKNRKDQIMMQKLIEKITKGIKVSDKEVEDYYKKHTVEFKDPEKVKIKWIFVATEKEAKEVLTKLQEGADFAATAKEKSVDPTTKDKGGELGLKSKAELPPEIADAAFKIELNKLSEVIKTQQGSAIFMVEEKQAERQKSFDESKAEIKNKLLSDKQRKAYEAWVAKLKKKAKIDKNI